MSNRAPPSRSVSDTAFLAMHVALCIVLGGILAYFKALNGYEAINYLATFLYLPAFYSAHAYRRRYVYVCETTVATIITAWFVYSWDAHPDSSVPTVLFFSAVVFFTAELLFQRRQAERALQISEETARALLDASIESSILLDLDGCILAINEAAATRLGQEAEALVGQCVFDLLPPDVAEPRKARFDELLATGQPVRLEDQRAGRTYDHHAFPVFDAQGRITRVAAYARDVTEQKRLESELLDLAATDSLTNLNNRRHFMEALERTLGQA